jgi:hypothetical protein
VSLVVWERAGGDARSGGVRSESGNGGAWLEVEEGEGGSWVDWLAKWLRPAGRTHDCKQKWIELG